VKGDSDDGLTTKDSFKNWRNLDRQQQQQQQQQQQHQQQTISSSNSTTYLSRKRRFIYPAVTPWLFDLRITIVIPLQGFNFTNFLEATFFVRMYFAFCNSLSQGNWNKSCSYNIGEIG